MSNCEHGISLDLYCTNCECIKQVGLLKDKLDNLDKLESENQQLKELLRESVSYVEYAENDRYKNTAFTRFLNQDELKEILGGQ